MNMEVCSRRRRAGLPHAAPAGVRKQRKPLIVMTPKSLLRHKDAAPRWTSWPTASSRPSSAKSTTRRQEGQARRLLFRQGLLRSAGRRREKKITDIAIARLEQLYPFPKESFQKELAKYPKATEIVWCQEEPRNQGAWYWIASRQHLVAQLGSKQNLLLVSRPASRRRRSATWRKHNEQQKALIESALGKIEY
jgi:2-oxoglutarate dehydrogenase E1 component